MSSSYHFYYSKLETFYLNQNLPVELKNKNCVFFIIIKNRTLLELETEILITVEPLMSNSHRTEPVGTQKSRLIRGAKTTLNE